jgi:hypothetical protein
MTEVEILGIVVTHQYGTLNTGDVLRTDPAFARHLVEDCGAAKYRAQSEEASAEPAADTAAEVAPSLAKPVRKPKPQ